MAPQSRPTKGKRRWRCQRIRPLFLTVGFVVVLFLLSLILTLLLVPPELPFAHAADSVASLTTNGPESLKEGRRLFEAGDYNRAALYYWRAVLFQEQNRDAYTVEESFQGFIGCYAVQGRTADGFLFIAKESMQRKQKEMALQYIEQALALEPDNQEALHLKERFEAGGQGLPVGKRKERQNKFQPNYGTPEASNPLQGKSPEDLYEYGSTLFSRKNYEHCADVFELSCQRSGYSLGPSCSNAIYCRMMIMDWGFNGTGFEQDMELLEELTISEKDQWRTGDLDRFQWQRATSVHPHMMLGYPLPPILKRYVAESVAFMDEMMARVDKNMQVVPLPDDLPYDHQADLNRYVSEASQPNFKVKIGFVGSGFNSKAVLFLSQDIFRFYDREKIEMHVFSCGPADNENFIKYGMNNVDWRKRVKGNVDYFHDVEEMKMSHIDMARYIHDQGIHVLIEWDGYARQGERAQGLLALRPAPVQVLHQEYLGTSGAQYIDYIVADKTVIPDQLTSLYSERGVIYLPNHFFSKGHAVQNEVKKPTYDYLPAKKPYKIGTGSPEENACLTNASIPPKFVFCNFNKFLKNSPETVRCWLRILREVPGSILCLLENPKSGTDYLRRFVHEAAGTPTLEENGTGEKVPSFMPGDGDALNARIHFVGWEMSPFDHQARNQDLCHAMLDSHPYNGHTVAQDSLYGGVPIVTRSDGDDMSSRVTTSANLVLGLEELNAYEGTTQYEDIAIALGTNRTKFDDVRRRLIDTAVARNPMHPYWDAPRYVKNLESGLLEAWNRFVSGQPPASIHVVESEETRRGTFEDVLRANPSDKPVHDEL